MFLLDHASHNTSYREGKRVSNVRQELASGQEDPGPRKEDDDGAYHEEYTASLSDQLVFGCFMELEAPKEKGGCGWDQDEEI